MLPLQLSQFAPRLRFGLAGDLSAAAFAAQRVAIDFAGFPGETLHGVIQEPLDKIRAGRLVPESITLRMLLPDTSKPMALPCRIDDLGDDPDFRQRADEITRRATNGIADSVHELAELGLVQDASVQIRVHDATPLFKLYLLNDVEAFFGFYPVIEHKVNIDGESHPMYDLMGKDAVLFHHARDDDDTSTGSQYVDQARMWFDSMWNTIGREASP